MFRHICQPYPLVRHQFWDYLGNLRSVVNGPWMLVGDFNEILLPSDVRGGSFYSNRALKFGDILDACSMVDLGFKGPLFMWHHSMQRGQRTDTRLDRAVADCNWRLVFPKVVVYTCTICIQTIIRCLSTFIIVLLVLVIGLSV